MRHKNKIKKLGRDAEHRRALMRNQVISLFTHGRIRTTLQKAKETRRYAEKMITLAKKGDLHSRRMALSFLTDRKITGKLFHVIAPLFADRNGGYTRIIRLGPRKGDGAEEALLELLEFPREEKEESGKSKKEKGKKEKKTGQ
ncbi:MAG: 50S ribosomal protein L17 [Candidatus Hydrothermae bacterium]|uniref:Large ribosomal subunit protein bL17 n=1 Tax=candidate division WOR-3 bacterium TaxID=2052148 RepID=A0A7C1BER0_UNCW3|nr:50S ribosomal protein L17 [Candidatus Hydrothermae bacterium]RKY93770.1 MAG: 50S ribosomal protein L17 [Candidatus Hydrothermae bacterium]RKZ04997.1 MAG: 50S ribosomal protein L17 [Candidatus Hydrothermae bacterium]HDM89640.1 50S ribosomal protein L17 [candidate division WOR-3 bacterium]